MSWLIAIVLAAVSAMTAPLRAPDDLLTRLQADHTVRTELLGRDRPTGAVLCGINVLERRGATTYAWLLCGDFRTGPDAAMLSGGADPVVIDAAGVHFPSHAHRFEDIGAMFPPELVDRVKQGQLPVTPTQDELLTTARALPAASACRAVQLDARHPDYGGAAGGTYFLTVALTNEGPDCALTTGALELWADGAEVATLDLADRHDVVAFPSGWHYRLRASVPNVDCFATGAHAAVLALSDPSADGPGQAVAGGAVPDSYVLCGGVRLSGAAPRAAPSR